MTCWVQLPTPALPGSGVRFPKSQLISVSAEDAPQRPCFYVCFQYTRKTGVVKQKLWQYGGACSIIKAIPHNSKCRYGERGAADAKPKAQIILDAAKVSAASGGNSEPKRGQRSQSARGFCPRSTMRVPQPDIIEHFGDADAVPQLPERCLSRKAGIVRCCPKSF